jgi:membrane protein
VSAEDGAARAARVARLQSRAEEYARSRPFIARLWRTAARYVEVRVSRLAAFVTYYGFLALFPLAALGFAVVGLLSRYLPQLDDAVIGQVTDHGGALGLTPQIVEQLQRAALGLGLISLGFLLYAGVRFMEALREALALVYGGRPPRGKLATRVGADVVLLLLFGVVLIGSLILSAITTTSAGWVTEALNIPPPDGVLRLAAFAASYLGSSVLLGLVMWRLAGRPVRRRVLVQGALVGGFGFEVLKAGATVIIASSLSNPVYGVFAVTIGMLVWINFTAKWVLMVAAWVAVADDQGLGVDLMSAGPTGGGHEALPAALVTSSSAEGEQADDGPSHDERPAEPAGDRPGG